jgi:putative Mg2+ transporter-C (MgtC) family protein
MMMLLPSVFHFSRIDQMGLSQGMTTRLLMACAMGGVIGIEREWRHKASGLRTNMLICMGCALFTMLSAVLAGEGNPDKGRVASNIVQGIGFLGAGLILHTRNRVLGLTSAATVFVVASIGMACGAGLYIEAALATLIVLLALTLIGSLEWKVGWQRYPMVYEVRGTDQGRMYSAILQVLDAAGERLSVLERESVGGLERIAFVIKVTRRKHEILIGELRAKDATDQVMAFNDPEEE